jgi:hypothetical protein
MRNVSDKSCTENYKTFYFQKLFPPNRAVYEIMWENVTEQDRPQIMSENVTEGDRP